MPNVSGNPDAERAFSGRNRAWRLGAAPVVALLMLPVATACAVWPAGVPRAASAAGLVGLVTAAALFLKRKAAALQKRLDRALEELATCRDAESRAQENEAALRRERQFSRTVIDHLPGIFYLYAYPENRLLMWNRQHEQRLGFDAAEMSGRHFADWFAEEDRDAAISAVETMMARGHASIEADLVGKDGRRMRYALSGVGLEDGGRRYFLGVGTDVTERRRAESELEQYRHHLADLVRQRTEELERAKDAAEAASLAKSRFLSTMSHEIRTPMNSVLGMANLLRRTGLTPLQAEYLGKIDAAATHLIEMLNGVLDLARVEAGKFVLEERPVAVPRLLDEVCSIISERARAKSLRVACEAGALPPGLHGDPTRIKQALLNYAANAVKFTERGSVTLRASLQEDGGSWAMLRFEVEDTGIGIAADAQGRLFEPFGQADASIPRRFGGSGLGLSITRQLAELMGGAVGVDSAPGRGSTFWLTVRLRKRDRPHAGERVGEIVDAARVLQQRHHGRRILLVDDDQVNLEIAGFLLRDAGLAVDTAEDGEEAVARAAATVYAAIVMDVQLPRLDGLEAARRIRAMPGHHDTPIVALTANVFAEDQSRCLAAGMDDFIGKPFDFDVFLATILGWLE